MSETNFSSLKLEVYNPGKDAVFESTSTIIYGEQYAYVVDAQFQKKYALQLVDKIKGLGRTLKLIFISHYDPDFYFGLDVLHEAFPEARILSTAQTAYLISASKDDKIAVWKDQLGDDAPSQLFVPEAVEAVPDLEGNKIEIMSRKDDPGHSYLWIPGIKTVLGGNSVNYGFHLWMADTQTPDEIQQALAVIEDIKNLHPEVVVPMHFTQPEFDPKKNLKFVHDYLAVYLEAVRKDSTADGIIAFMKAEFPELGKEQQLEFGAKVFAKELPWTRKNPYPPIERAIVVNFGIFSFRNSFSDNLHMHFEGLDGDYKGQTDDVEYTAVEVARRVFMVYWSEPKSKARVVHVQNYNDNTVWTNIAYPDGSFYHLSGTLTLE